MELKVEGLVRHDRVYTTHRCTQCTVQCEPLTGVQLPLGAPHQPSSLHVASHTQI